MVRRSAVRRLALLLSVCLFASISARAANVVDSTGRTVTIPDRISRVLPAGAPAAILLAAIAPDLMIGWPNKPGPEGAALLSDVVAGLPSVPRLTGSDAPIDAVDALHPDLVLDYGSTTPRYASLAEEVQARTGVATLLLDGHLSLTPLALRLLGKVLHREARGEELARFAEGVLASAGSHAAHATVVMVHGPEGGEVVRPGVGNSEVLEFLGLSVLAPPGPADERSSAPYRAASIADIAKLDPDLLLFASAEMAAKVKASPQWRALRAVREHRAWIVPGAPFGWLDMPPSLNRLLGLAWLSSGQPDPAVLPFAAVFHAVVYGRTPTPSQLRTLRASLAPIQTPRTEP